MISENVKKSCSRKKNNEKIFFDGRIQTKLTKYYLLILFFIHQLLKFICKHILKPNYSFLKHILYIFKNYGRTPSIYIHITSLHGLQYTDFIYLPSLFQSLHTTLITLKRYQRSN